MSETLKWQLFLILLIVGIAGYIAYPDKDKPLGGKGELLENCYPQPGLDLQGGSEIRVGLKKEGLPDEKIKSGTDQAKSIIERRINLYGLKEPRIQRYGNDQILIQLPGMDLTEVERIKKIITSAGKLDLKLEAEKPIVERYSDRFPQTPSGYLWYESADSTERGDRVLVKEKAELTGENIVEAGTTVSPKEGVVVTFKLDPRGTKVLADVTKKYAVSTIGEENARRLAIILDNKLVSAPRINTPIPDGEGIITGRFTQQQGQDLATVLRSGSLPAPLEIVSESYVGPTLGQDSIKRGIISFVLAVGAVILFMLIYYHVAGLIANIALAMNFILIWGTLSFFSATFTLPGIAALVLTLGMAVDANILFYERIREEKERGKDIRQAFESGFNRALVTVVDANLTTLLAGLILCYFGSGPLKGFAIVLCVGILTTLFTAYFASKVMLKICIESGLIKTFSMFKLFSKPNIGFMNARRVFFAISLLLVAFSVGIFITNGRSSYGIDFTGGTVINVKFRNATDIAEVRNTIQVITTNDATGRTIAKYPDVEVQSMMPRLEQTSEFKASDIWATQAKRTANEFQVRTKLVSTAEGVRELKSDLKTAFGDKIPLDAITGIDAITDTAKSKLGYRLKMTVNLEQPRPVTEIKDKLNARLEKDGLTKSEIPEFAESTDTAKTAIRFEGYFKDDKEAQIEKLVRDEFGLSEGPFPMVESISGVVAKELQQNAVIAIILSWLGIIIYLAVRFEFKYGIAAVIALVHDVLVSMGSIVLFNLLVPKSWGITLDINLSSVAAFLTIVGYSVNDTIVTFDRIRENVKIMKGESFNKIMDISVNQTLSRTILTSLTVFL
ncbi:MAG: protein translocase subunit SecD, partial [Planctomycetes bacterium]|nr:protein translocase subunit SecD [Planctomycetota bacterium]